jgi:hypothetical protein
VWPIERRTLHGTNHADDQAVLTAIRTGRHGTYERLVLEFSGGFGDVSVGYLPTPFILTDPADQVLRLRGNVVLSVTIQGAVATWNGVGHKPYPGPFTVTPNLPTLKQVSLAGDFEAVLSFGVGLDRIAGFHVDRVAGPDRLVIDVAERPNWRLWPEDNLAMARSTQSAVDQGHQPWRGDPIAVVRAYAAAMFGWQNANASPVYPGAYRIHRDGASIIVHTAAPFSTTTAHSIVLIADTR